MPPPAANDTAPDFGPNVLIFDPSMDTAAIESKTHEVFEKQERNEFGPERYAFFFKPGAYNAHLDVGFYTQVYGLGRMPDDTTITGEIKSSGAWDNGNGTRNFWRGIENLAIAPTGSHETWAVSQAAPFRRVHVKGELWLFEGGWTSGGYMADCKIDGRVVSGSQQQWFSRNTEWAEWDGGVWNMVFLGITNPPSGTWPTKPYTTVDATPAVREKPFLFLDSAGRYAVFVPAPKKAATGYGLGRRRTGRRRAAAGPLLYRARRPRHRRDAQRRARAGSQPPAHAGHLQPRRDAACDAPRHDRARAGHGHAGAAERHQRDGGRRRWRRHDRQPPLRRGCGQFAVLLQVGEGGQHRLACGTIPPTCRTFSAAWAARRSAWPTRVWSSTATTSSATTRGSGARTTAPAPAGTRTRRPTG
ncbi:MAG: hypothetical protein WDO13_13925 [Verrucomicrobiota bacterium]